MSPGHFPSLRILDHPLVRIRVTTLRDAGTPPALFRRTLRELTTLMTFEVTRSLEIVSGSVQTPLASATGHRLARPVVIVPILRAGLGMADAILEVIPEASVGHIGMFRDEETLRPQSYYCRQPDGLEHASVLLLDPMLATGHSAVEAIRQLKIHGATDITLVCIVCCPEGVGTLLAAHPGTAIFSAAMDEGLNDRGYILPGLGDAGDRYFGT